MLTAQSLMRGCGRSGGPTIRLIGIGTPLAIIDISCADGRSSTSVTEFPTRSAAWSDSWSRTSDQHCRGHETSRRIRGQRELALVSEFSQQAPGRTARPMVRNHRFATGRHWRRGVFEADGGNASEALMGSLPGRFISRCVPPHLIISSVLFATASRSWLSYGGRVCAASSGFLAVT